MNINAINILDLAHGVKSKKEMEEHLVTDFRKAHKTSGLVVIIFLNCRKAFAKDEVLPLIQYWNERSHFDVTFFFPGCTIDYDNLKGADVKFNDKAFVKIIEAFESLTDWKNHGDSPIIICRAQLGYDKNNKLYEAILDLNTFIEFQIERALKEGAIASVESFFEMVIDAAKTTPGEKVNWKLSDLLGGKALSDALVEAIISKLPAGTKKLVDAVRFFRIKS